MLLKVVREDNATSRRCDRASPSEGLELVLTTREWLKLLRLLEVVLYYPHTMSPDLFNVIISPLPDFTTQLSLSFYRNDMRLRIICRCCRRIMMGIAGL